MKLSYFKENFFSSKILALFSFLLFLPCLVILIFLYLKDQKLSLLEERVDFLQKRIEKKKSTLLEEEKIFSKIQKANKRYLEEQINTLEFLEPEQQKWKMFLAQAESSQEMREKYAFLENLDNKLCFVFVGSQKGPLFEEMEFSQKKPVQLNEEDLKKLLCSLEGEKIGSYIPPIGIPEIFITSFSLEKNTLSEMQERTYLVSNIHLFIRQQGTPCQ